MLSPRGPRPRVAGLRLKGVRQRVHRAGVELVLRRSRSVASFFFGWRDKFAATLRHTSSTVIGSTLPSARLSLISARSRPVGDEASHVVSRERDCAT